MSQRNSTVSKLGEQNSTRVLNKYQKLPEHAIPEQHLKDMWWNILVGKNILMNLVNQTKLKFPTNQYINPKKKKKILNNFLQITLIVLSY